MSIGHQNGSRYKSLVTLGESPNDCWGWTGSINKRTGYGKKQWHGESVLAHRWVWMMLFGKIPDGKVINHKCSNRKCVNPHHLEVVTQSENCRHGAGTKLTADAVKSIRQTLSLRRSTATKKNLAFQHGVSVQTITDIDTGRSWRSLN